MKNKLVLVDGNSIVYRAFFALPLLNNDKGVYTNAVYGFTTMLLRILEEENPSHMLVAFDAGKTTFRHKTYKDYKGGREKTPPELSEQFPLVRELLDAFQIKHYELEAYEADDIIGTLAKGVDAKDWEIKIYSGDKDLLQLVDEHITLAMTRKGISEIETFTPQYMKEKLEVTPEQIIDLKALMGDKSDNIPGVPGVGEKTATKLLKQYDTLENVYAHIDELPGKKLKENLTTYKEDAFLSKELVTINCESPVEIKTKDITYVGHDTTEVTRLFKDLGFQSLLNRMDGDNLLDHENDWKEISYKVLDEVTQNIFTGKDALFLEILEENYHQEPIIGIGIANERGVYLFSIDTALNSSAFKEWVEDETKEKIVFDTKKSLVLMLRNGLQLKGITFDMLLASYLLNPAENHDTIPEIAHEMNKKQVKYDAEVYGKGKSKKIPELDVFHDHLARKVKLLFELKDEIAHQLQENEQYQLLFDLEMPLAHILAEMEYTGVKVDVARLEKMGTELKERLDTIEREVIELAGESFNLNSPKQLGIILFEKLGLPVIKKTKTGYSTAIDVLEKLYDKHDIIPKIVLYRQLGKLQSTYIEGLLKVVHTETEKIHTRFNQALTQTGRLSSVDPNLQNIPIRLEEGRKIRQAFVPSEKDWVIFSFDYSQIELRVLAHISNDERLTRAFKDDMDIHTQTAMDVFHVDKESVTSDMRRQAKTVNFGIVYGISDYGLSQNLGITRKEAKKFIDTYFEIYPGVKQYMKDIVQEAKHKGYVTTIMQRRRYLPDITSRNFNLRSFAERTAINTPIQGSAADIIKKAMIDLDEQLKKHQLNARLLLQVHDELILEAPEEEVKQLIELVTDCMENAVSLNVPLKVDYSYGKSWFDV